MKASMTAVKKALQGKRVIRTVSGLLTVEQIPQMREELLALLSSNNIPQEQLAEDDLKFFIKDGNQYWMKPKLRGHAAGTLSFRSRDYLFLDEARGENPEPSYGELTGLIPLDDNTGFYKPVKEGKITYQLAE